ncbi:hypothetical protein GCM10023194_70580 [Planotetraspora phitsanulokensis]|uniref:ketopantoate reductase family protein n=1 Tax=Planotetraspora phitsanulokensis TaxID=575192 RepID=UPI001950DC6D
MIRAFVERARESGPPSTPSYTSMTRDVMASRPTEVDFMFGDLVRRAAKVGVGVPRIALAHAPPRVLLMLWSSNL